jgi:hypothetical protein
MVICAMALLGSTARADQGPCTGVAHKIPRLGGSTRFHKPITSLEQLQKAFQDQHFRKDVDRILKEKGLSALSEPLAQAVASGENVAPVKIDPGTRFEWMAYRKHGPHALEEPCWNGRDPFNAWQLTLSDSARDYVFIIPEACGNLSLLPPSPPVCQLTVTKDCRGVTLDASASTRGSKPITRYVWTIGDTRKDTGEPVFKQPSPCPPNESCHASVQVIDQYGQHSAVCDQPVDFTPCPPVCAVSAKENCEAKSIDVDTSGSHGAADLALKSVTVAAEPALDLQETEPLKHFRADRPQPQTTTSYTFTATVTDELGTVATCKTDPALEIEPPPTCKVAASRLPGADVVRVDLTGTSERHSAKVAGPDGKDVPLDGQGLDRGFTPGPAGVYRVDVSAGTKSCPDAVKCSTEIEVPCCDRTPWTVRVYGGVFQASDDVFHETLSAGTRFEERRQFKIGGNNMLFGAGAEYRPRLADRSRGPWGFTFDVMRSEVDLHVMLDTLTVWAMDEDGVSVTPLLAGVSYHLLPSSAAADLWLGANAGWMDYGTAHLKTDSRDFPERFGGDFAYGLAAGADVPFGRHRCWLFSGALRYLKASTDVHGPSGFTLDVDPLIATVGFGYRF